VLTDKAAFSSCVGSKSAKTNLCGDFSGWNGSASYFTWKLSYFHIYLRLSCGCRW